MPAEYLEESFEGTGYENAWTAEQGSGCTIDPDNTDVAPPTGGGSQILKQIAIGNSVTNRIYIYLDGNKPITYTTFYFRLASLIDGGSFQPFYAEDTTYKHAIYVTMKRNGSTYTLELWLYDNGAPTLKDSKTISLDAWPKIDIKYDVTGATWEWRIDGLVEGSGSLTGTLAAGIRSIFLKSTGSIADYTATAYWDKVWIDDSEYGYGQVDSINLIWTK